MRGNRGSHLGQRHPHKLHRGLPIARGRRRIFDQRFTYIGVSLMRSSKAYSSSFAQKVGFNSSIRVVPTRLLTTTPAFSSEVTARWISMTRRLRIRAISERYVRFRRRIVTSVSVMGD